MLLAGRWRIQREALLSAEPRGVWAEFHWGGRSFVVGGEEKLQEMGCRKELPDLQDSRPSIQPVLPMVMPSSQALSKDYSDYSFA